MSRLPEFVLAEPSSKFGKGKTETSPMPSLQGGNREMVEKLHGWGATSGSKFLLIGAVALVPSARLPDAPRKRGESPHKRQEPHRDENRK